MDRAADYSGSANGVTINLATGAASGGDLALPFPAGDGGQPDPAAALDPALNPEVSQATINDTICAPGYSYTVRPSYWESARVKLAMLKARGETWLDAPKYELDHIIPLCLGGSPADPSNWDEATRKDRVEIQAMRCV